MWKYVSVILSIIRNISLTQTPTPQYTTFLEKLIVIFHWSRNSLPVWNPQVTTMLPLEKKVFIQDPFFHFTFLFMEADTAQLV
jgi:predicted AAA+ superfamily ATPase